MPEACVSWPDGRASRPICSAKECWVVLDEDSAPGLRRIKAVSPWSTFDPKCHRPANCFNPVPAQTCWAKTSSGHAPAAVQPAGPSWYSTRCPAAQTVIMILLCSTFLLPLTLYYLHITLANRTGTVINSHLNSCRYEAARVCPAMRNRHTSAAAPTGSSWPLIDRPRTLPRTRRWRKV